MRTLLLDQVAWDLCLDAEGNIAVASNPYAIAQDVASEARVFHGECYFDTTKGIYYFEQILGHYPPLEAMRAQYVAAALTVPGVVDAVCFFNAIRGRRLAGQILVTDANGRAQNVSF